MINKKTRKNGPPSARRISAWNLCEEGRKGKQGGEEGATKEFLRGDQR